MGQLESWYERGNDIFLNPLFSLVLDLVLDPIHNPVPISFLIPAYALLKYGP